MKIAVIGATGLAGNAVVNAALALNNEVVAIVRNPKKINPADRLKIVKGNVLDIRSLIEAFEEVDGVISCIGPDNARSPSPADFMSQSIANIIEACEKSGVTKFVMMSGILQSDGKELSLLNSLLIKFIRLFYHKVYKDKIIAEKSIENSSLDWVIVRAAGLEKKHGDKNYTAEPKAKISPFKPLPHTDCADCLLRALKEKEWNKKIINVGSHP